MKKLALLSFAIVLIISACNNSSTSSSNSTQTFNLDTTKLKNGESFYQCEMNPEVISDKPGSCPKCGMDLEKINKK
jgi:uncharacterized protein YcfL